MKNIVIVILAFVAAVLGYFLWTNSKADSPTGSVTTSQLAKDDQVATENSKDKIDLSGQNLSTFPKDIINKTGATALDVSNNNLTGSLPAEIRKLANLETLDASNNKMTGIPAEIGQLSKLKEANFANNNLSGLPLEIGNLKNLETLDLRGNPNISKLDISRIQKDIPNTKILTD